MATPPQQLEAQHQNEKPGFEHPMKPLPQSGPKTKGAGRLEAEVALITGGDSGIGRAVALAFVFLASEEASYITGQVIHVNDGEVVNG